MSTSLFIKCFTHLTSLDGRNSMDGLLAPLEQ